MNLEQRIIITLFAFIIIGLALVIRHLHDIAQVLHEDAKHWNEDGTRITKGDK
jgi:uncharacterized membrane protein YedE/YeeE